MLRLRHVAAALPLVAVAALTGCDRRPATAPSPTATAPRLVVIEQGEQLLRARDRGAVYTLRLANHGTAPVAFAVATAGTAAADPALTVTVLGLTTCARGCVGGGPLTAQTEREARASVDPSLTAVPPSSTESRATGSGLMAVVLLVRVAEHPAPGTCAYVRSLTAGDVTATAPGGEWVAAVSTPDGDVAPDC